MAVTATEDTDAEPFSAAAGEEASSPAGDEEEEEDDSLSSDRWEDTPITTQMWQLISSGNVEGLNRFYQSNPRWVTLRSADGRGALFWAYEYQQSKIISMLINAGVPTDVRDSQGSTPAELAPAGFKHFHDPSARFIIVEAKPYGSADEDESGTTEEDSSGFYNEPPYNPNYEEDEEF